MFPVSSRIFTPQQQWPLLIRYLNRLKGDKQNDTINKPTEYDKDRLRKISFRVTKFENLKTADLIPCEETK